MDTRQPGNIAHKTKNEKIFMHLLDLPKTIQVADKPLRLGGTITEVSAQTFAEECNMTAWTGSMVFDANPREQVSKSKKINAEILYPFAAPYIFEEITKNMGSQVICNMGDAGHGVFASKNLPKGSWVGVYTGEIESIDTLFSSSSKGAYAVAISDMNGSILGAADCVNYGNVPRFYQHLPLKTNDPAFETVTLEDYQFTGIDPRQVATANLEIIPYLYQGSIIFLFRTTRDVKEGEQLGWDYGNKYWPILEIVPSIFDTKGATIDPNSYTLKKVLLRVHESEETKMYADLFVSPEKLNEVFTRGPLGINASNQIMMTLTQEDFEQAYKKYPHSPFVVVDRASYVEPIPSPMPAQAPEENKEEPKQKNSTLRPGFFNQNISLSVRNKLNQVTSLLSLPEWKYHDTKKIAHLTAEHPEDKAKMKLVAEHLKKTGLIIKLYRHETSKCPIIFVSDANKLLSPDMNEIEKMAPPVNLPKPGVNISPDTIC